MLLKTPLFDRHVSAGAKMVEFAGYDMPVQYGGVISEAKSVRERAGIFDVSHMARLRVSGSNALDFLEQVTTNDVSRLTDGMGQYSLFGNEAGGCIDDLILFRESATEFVLVVNASNHAKDVGWLTQHLGDGVRLADETDSTALIAIQGPEAASMVNKLSGGSVTDTAAFGSVHFRIEGIPIYGTRSGYTGEDGFELTVAAAQSEALWDILVKSGAAPCGLAARDSLRVEAGLPLYGHELGDEMSPIAAGIGWAISKVKRFIGSDDMNRVRSEKPARRLVGVKLNTKRLLSPGMSILVGGQPVGELTSGVYSVVLECGIGLGFVDRQVEVGTTAEIDIRGRPEPCTITSKRFLGKKSC